MNSPVTLEQVFAQDLNGASAQFGVGLHVVLATPRDGGASLVALLSGATRPKRGQVLIDGKAPHSTPALRARIGSLLADEPAAGRRGRVADRRAAALERALSHEQPALLALFEPLSNISNLDRAAVVRRIQERSTRSPTLCVTESVRDAVDLGGQVILLDGGRFVRRPGDPLGTELAPGPTNLRVRAKAPELLAARLCQDSAVTSIAFDIARRPEQVTLSGPDMKGLSLAILRAAADGKVGLLSLAPEYPSLDEARAATTALWRAAYERAYTRAREFTAAPAAAAAPAAPAAVQPPPESPPAASTGDPQ